LIIQNQAQVQVSVIKMRRQYIHTKVTYWNNSQTFVTFVYGANDNQGENNSRMK